MSRNSSKEKFDTTVEDVAVSTQVPPLYNEESEGSHPEIDVPLDNDNLNNAAKYYSTKPAQKNFKVITDAALLQCSQEGLKNVLDYHDNMDRHKYKRYGFWTIVGTLGAFLIISVIDMFLVNNVKDYQESSILEGFIDLLKYVIPTLIGFVFADSKGTKSKSDEKKK